MIYDKRASAPRLQDAPLHEDKNLAAARKMDECSVLLKAVNQAATAPLMEDPNALELDPG
jgi:hypothetical protein